ncbi:GH15217 [Drosophila grimshawi]|uniref:GH15217 n=2 Tax=Drosophila grimshawi TaxID=7222 RepID=B4IXG9_DROGR|nr:GH15217 [Drosophila grimshawi]
MSETIDELLAGLAAARQTMQRQIDKIGEIMEKSNSTLLHIESQNTNLQLPLTTTATTAQNVYNVSANCQQSVVKILLQFQQLIKQTAGGDSNADGQSVLNSCLSSRQRIEFLGSSVRKLVGLCDIIAQLKESVEVEQQLNTDEEDELYSE